MPDATLSLIRRVDPGDLHAVEGWNAALEADRHSTGPRWQRGDIGTPIQLAEGTLFVFADTWCRNQHGPYLVRNSAVWVDHRGAVSWLSGPVHSALVTLSTAFGWWWPAGGIPSGSSSAQLFGSTWHPGPLYGRCEGPAVVEVNVEQGAVSDVVPLDLPTDFTWGPPHRAGDMVHMAGFNPATWEHAIAGHAYCDEPEGYAGDWKWTNLEIDSPPLGALSLRRWRRGWLASAKILCSGPELDFDETPEIAAWFSPEPAGPYIRLPDPVDDTTRTDWRTYGAQLVELPHVGLVALWNANADAELVSYDVGGYGPKIDRAWLPSAASHWTALA